MNFKITQHDPDGRVVTKKPVIHSNDSTKFFEFGFAHETNQVFEIEITDETADETPLHYSMRVGERLKESVDAHGENYSSFEELVKFFVSSKHFMNTVIVNRAYIIVDTIDDIIYPVMIEEVQHICLGRNYKFILNKGSVQLHINI